MHTPDEIAAKLWALPYEALDERAKKVARHIAGRTHIARNVAQEFDAQPTPGQRAADAVASFGGSWTFVGLFAAVMLFWVGLNAYLLMRHGETFDPYPYILLNLFLSMLAAIQAPIILMSQHRQSEKDRISAGHDYEVNLKAELEIMLLHDKLDGLRETQWGELLQIQTQQNCWPHWPKGRRAQASCRDALASRKVGTDRLQGLAFGPEWPPPAGESRRSDVPVPREPLR